MSRAKPCWPNLIGIAQMAVMIVPYATYAGKEYRRTAAPEFGISLPQVFLSILVDALQLGAVGRDLYGECSV